MLQVREEGFLVEQEASRSYRRVSIVEKRGGCRRQSDVKKRGSVWFSTRSGESDRKIVWNFYSGGWEMKLPLIDDVPIYLSARCDVFCSFSDGFDGRERKCSNRCCLLSFEFGRGQCLKEDRARGMRGVGKEREERMELRCFNSKRWWWSLSRRCPSLEVSDRLGSARSLSLVMNR